MRTIIRFIVIGAVSPFKAFLYTGTLIYFRRAYLLRWADLFLARARGDIQRDIIDAAMQFDCDDTRIIITPYSLTRALRTRDLRSISLTATNAASDDAPGNLMIIANEI